MPDGGTDIILSIDAGIASVVLDRRPVNAFNDVLIGDFHEILDQIEARDDISVLHISSALQTFSAGADLSGVSGLEARRLEQACGDAATKLPEGFTIKPCSSQPAE